MKTETKLTLVIYALALIVIVFGISTSNSRNVPVDSSNNSSSIEEVEQDKQNESEGSDKSAANTESSNSPIATDSSQTDDTSKTTEEEKPEAKISKIVLDVKNIQQMPEMPTGCEIVSGAIVLNYYGIKCPKDGLYKFMPKMVYPDADNKWESPWNVFVGDPFMDFYGCYSPVLKTTIEKYWENKKITDYEVVDLLGKDLEDLYEEINAGNPVIVWATVEMKPVKKGTSWKLQDGKTFNWLGGEHCLVLIGYDKEKDTVILSDPYDERGTVTYKRKTFEARYKDLEKQALVIHKK